MLRRVFLYSQWSNNATSTKSSSFSPLFSRQFSTASCSSHFSLSHSLTLSDCSKQGWRGGKFSRQSEQHHCLTLANMIYDLNLFQLSRAVEWEIFKILQLSCSSMKLKWNAKLRVESTLILQWSLTAFNSWLVAALLHFYQARKCTKIQFPRDEYLPGLWGKISISSQIHFDGFTANSMYKIFMKSSQSYFSYRFAYIPFFCFPLATCKCFRAFSFLEHIPLPT